MQLSKYTILRLLTLITVCYSCQKEKVEEDYIKNDKDIVEYDLLDTTVPLEEVDEFFFTEIDSITWQVDKRTAVAEDLKVGSVFGGGLTDKFPTPYLKYIEEVNDVGSNLILKVRQAGIVEAFENLNIDIAITDANVGPRSITYPFAIGPTAFTLDASGSATLDPTFDITYDQVLINIGTTGTTVNNVDYEIKGIRTIACLSSSISGILDGSAAVTFPVANIPIALPTTPPILLSSRIVFKATVECEGSGSYEDKITSTSDKLDIKLSFTGLGVNVTSNVDEVSWINDVDYDINNASGSITADIGGTIEYQISAYEAYAVSHLYMGVQPLGVRLEATKNITLPQIDTDLDLVVKVIGGARVSTLGINFLTGKLSNLNFNLASANIELLDLPIDIFEGPVPLNCPVDGLEVPTITASCSPNSDQMTLLIRWNADPSITEEFILKVGPLVSNFYAFNTDHTVSVNPEWYGYTNEIVFEHEDFEGCQYRYTIDNPCVIESNCPGGICEQSMKDGRIWMTKNIKDNDSGICHPSDDGCNSLGQFFTYEELLNGSELTQGFQGVCPSGYHVPTADEWGNLFNAYRIVSQSPGPEGIGTLLTPRIEGITDWDIALASGFNLMPSGAHHPWIGQDATAFEGSLFDDGGKFIIVWTSDIKPVTDNENIWPKVTTFNLDTYKIEESYMTKDIALPCRCIKNE